MASGHYLSIYRHIHRYKKRMYRILRICIVVVVANVMTTVNYVQILVIVLAINRLRSEYSYLIFPIDIHRYCFYNYYKKLQCVVCCDSSKATTMRMSNDQSIGRGFLLFPELNNMCRFILGSPLYWCNIGIEMTLVHNSLSKDHLPTIVISP